VVLEGAQLLGLHEDLADDVHDAFDHESTVPEGGLALADVEEHDLVEHLDAVLQGEHLLHDAFRVQDRLERLLFRPYLHDVDDGGLLEELQQVLLLLGVVVLADLDDLLGHLGVDLHHEVLVRVLVYLANSSTLMERNFTTAGRISFLKNSSFRMFFTMFWKITITDFFILAEPAR